MSVPEPPGHVKHVQMSRSAPPDGTCLHLLKPAQISRSPRDVLPLAQTSSDQLSLAQIHSDGSAASRKHVNPPPPSVCQACEIQAQIPADRRLGGENGVTPTGKSFRFVRACVRARRSCVGGREKSSLRC